MIPDRSFYSVFFFFTYIRRAAPIIMDAILTNWATLIPANIKLSVLKPSIKNLPAEYKIRYKPNI